MAEIRPGSRLAALIGEELRAARVRAGLSQAAVAERLGCSPALMSYRELGRVPISGPVLARWREVCGVTDD